MDGNKLDLIIGGPPCQAYSLVGRSRDKYKMQKDERNLLYLYYAEFLTRYRPRYFIFENVTGLLSAKDRNGKRYLDSMVTLFKKSGYKTEYKVLSAENYGILQKRKRIILVGKRGRKTDFYPNPEKWDPGVLAGEIFSGLPEIQAGQGEVFSQDNKKCSSKWLKDAGISCNLAPITWHTARPQKKQDLQIYSIAVALWNREKKRLEYNSLPERLKTHLNRDDFKDRFKVVASDLPYSHTVVAHIAKDGHYFIHPDMNQNRSITPREAARIQTFPDDYFFESTTGKPSRTAAFQQIGNAVPVLLAQKIAEKLKEIWR